MLSVPLRASFDDKTANVESQDVQSRPDCSVCIEFAALRAWTLPKAFRGNEFQEEYEKTASPCENAVQNLSQLRRELEFAVDNFFVRSRAQSAPKPVRTWAARRRGWEGLAVVDNGMAAVACFDRIGNELHRSVSQ